MTRTSVGDVREYYRLITDVDIGRVAREVLAERIVQEDDRLLQCDCPNHTSGSHHSLHILLDKQGWYCFGCGVGGDVLQLVEFVQSGTVTSGQSYGEPQQKKSTDAANYTDGSQNPLIVLDNIEVKQMTEELTTFLLTSITGIAKEKRKSGTDTETVIERTKCLLNTTGIEPLGGELAEILSRSFIVRFDMEEQASDCFLEATVLAAIGEHRDLIVSALLRRTSRVLALLRDGAQEKVMRLLHHTLGSHGKRRCNDYLSLMYLMLLSGEPPDLIDEALEELHPQFLDRVASLNRVSTETARESNPIATVLSALFKAYRHAIDADAESTALNVNKTNKAAFLERYQIDFRDETRIEGALARDLYIALNRLAKDFGLAFHMRSVQQFAQRFSNDLDTIRGVGFEITIRQGRSNMRTYDIRCINRTGGRPLAAKVSHAAQTSLGRQASRWHPPPPPPMCPQETPQTLRQL